MEQEQDKVLFATLYHYESIIHSLKELQNVKSLVLFVDDESDEIQKNSYEVIEKVTSISKIKIEKVKLDVTKFDEMFKKIDKCVKKHSNEEIHVDISHSVRTKTIGLITYFSVKYPENFKKMTFYAPWNKEIIEIPIFKAEKLSESKLQIIKYISKHKIFMMEDLAKELGKSKMQAYRLSNELQEEQYFEKQSGEWKLLIKGELIANLK